MHLEFDPPFMPIHTALLALGAAAGILWLYVRREMRSPTRHAWLLIGLRSAVVLALALILLNPIAVATSSRPSGKAPFLLLLDTSRSMCTADEAGGVTRYDAAKRQTVQNQALLDDLGRRYALHLFQFTDKPAAAGTDTLANLAKPNGDRTDLGAALAGSVGAFPAGEAGQVLLVSDGRDTSDSFPLDAARAARAQGFTIHTLCLGKQTQQRDLQVVARKTQVFASPGQAVQLGAEIRDTGISHASIRVSLLQDGRTVRTQQIAVEPGRRDVSFPVTQPHKGLYRYAIKADPAPGELNEANNAASVFLSVLNAKARVLFLEGRPSWDSKFLAQALRSDPTVSLDVIYKLTDTKFFAVLGNDEKETGVTLPRTAEQMSRYDVIIFGKGFEEFYDDAGAKALKEWIAERGGNVLFLRGRADERTAALREIEPVTWTDQQLDELKMRLTQEGKAHPGFAFSTSEDAQTVVRKMPPLVSATRVQGEKALAVVLARAEGGTDDQAAREMATLAYVRYGQGKSMAIVGQGLWRWAFLPPELENYGKVYDEFWTQTIRWMVSESDFLPGQSVSIRPDRSSYAPNETVSLLGYARSKSAAVPQTLALTLPNGSRTEIGTARGDDRRSDFIATYRPAVPGEYIATIPGAGPRSAPVSCVFTVAPGNEEDLNRSADPDLMRQLAAAGGGIAMTTDEIGGFPERLHAREAARTKKEVPHTAWDRPWVLAAILTALGAEWWIRRKVGLA